MSATDLILGGYAWYRRRKGGHWEQWWVSLGGCYGRFLWVSPVGGCREQFSVYVTREKCEDYPCPV